MGLINVQLTAEVETQMGLINVQLTTEILQELINVGCIDKPTFLQKLPQLKNHLGSHIHDSLSLAVRETLSPAEEVQYQQGIVEGKAAYHNDPQILYSANPHDPGTLPYRHAGWNRGWRRAEYQEDS